jgi:serine protease AprX
MEEKMRKILPVIIILVLMFTTIGSVAPYPGAATAKIHPLLAELAARAPDQIVSVIVQKTSISNQAEMLTQNLGGKITKDLHIINAFAAEMSAAAALQLAASPVVRWVSPDAPVRQSSDEAVFTTWATEAKTPTIGSFTNVSGILDSVNVPNDTYAYGGYVTAAFAGFSAELTPDYAITKVEVVLQAYAPAAPSADPILTISAAGVPGQSVVLDRHVFDNLIGPENAGLVVVDMTSTRTWQWSDFDPYLEIIIDQSNLSTSDTIYYDAVGLQVTSLPGEDASEPTVISNETSAPIDTSQMNNVYNQVIGSSQLWNEEPLFIQGRNNYTIAVVDSGVFKTKDLKSRIKKQVNFSINMHKSTDLYGHGTFVAGIIAGNGNGSNGKYIGVAPKAKLVSIRISDDQGMSNESDVISGLQWIFDNKDLKHIRVVNMSLNSSVEQSYHNSPLCAAVEILWFNGIVVVVSAGNNGTANLYPPANDPFVITVGATNDMGTVALSDDVIAPFSGYGIAENGLIKPELVAPGKNIISLLPDHRNLTISKQHPENRVTSLYFRMSGTSISAPMVSGAAALLLQNDPTLTPDQVKYRLMATANNNWPGYDANKAGAGYLDIYAAVHGTTTESANTDITASQLLWSGSEPVVWESVAWNSVAWNSVAWNSVAWNSVAWNSVAWNSDYWGQ